MAKKKDKAAPAAATGDAPAPTKRSKLKLALFAVLPLALAGGGYAGWTAFAAAPAEDAPVDAHRTRGPDPEVVAALARETAAETSFTYSFALSELTRGMCGEVRLYALKAAAEEEARADGLLVNLSWMAANRRMGTITEISCDYIRAEIVNADGKAADAAAAKAAEAEAKGH